MYGIMQIVQTAGCMANASSPMTNIHHCGEKKLRKKESED